MAHLLNMHMFRLDSLVCSPNCVLTIIQDQYVTKTDLRLNCHGRSLMAYHIPYIYVHIYYMTRLPKKTIVRDTPSKRPVGPAFQAISPPVTLRCLRLVQT